MPMTANGLAKLIEECGELTQVAGKKIAYYNTDIHPDGAGSLAQRLQDEIADVLAAAQFVAQNFQLDMSAIEVRRLRKLALFASWHADPANLPDSDGLIGLAAQDTEATPVPAVTECQRRSEAAFEGAYQALASTPGNEALLREIRAVRASSPPCIPATGPADLASQAEYRRRFESAFERAFRALAGMPGNELLLLEMRTVREWLDSESRYARRGGVIGGEITRCPWGSA
jgi:NTP pyrophosphatase (non-canonical NTP hydrolase)